MIMKKIIFHILFLNSLTSFSQSPDDMFAKDMGFNEKVLINNNLKSFVVGLSEKNNGINNEIEYFRNDFDNPFNIKITSTKNFGKIVINNKVFSKPFEVDFYSIYRKTEYREVVYFFATNNPNITIYYYKKPDQNDTLIITIKKDSNNNIMYLYTISNL